MTDVQTTLTFILATFWINNNSVAEIYNNSFILLSCCVDKQRRVALIYSDRNSSPCLFMHFDLYLSSNEYFLVISNSTFYLRVVIQSSCMQTSKFEVWGLGSEVPLIFIRSSLTGTTRVFAMWGEKAKDVSVEVHTKVVQDMEMFWGKEVHQQNEKKGRKSSPPKDCRLAEVQVGGASYRWRHIHCLSRHSDAQPAQSEVTQTTLVLIPRRDNRARLTPLSLLLSCQPNISYK